MRIGAHVASSSRRRREKRSFGVVAKTWVDFSFYGRAISKFPIVWYCNVIWHYFFAVSYCIVRFMLRSFAEDWICFLPLFSHRSSCLPLNRNRNRKYLCIPFYRDYLVLVYFTFPATSNRDVELRSHLYTPTGSCQECSDLSPNRSGCFFSADRWNVLNRKTFCFWDKLWFLTCTKQEREALNEERLGRFSPRTSTIWPAPHFL